jgi:hypothetical protein
MLLFWAAYDAGNPYFPAATRPAVWDSLTLRLGFGHFWTISVEVRHNVLFVV